MTYHIQLFSIDTYIRIGDVYSKAIKKYYKGILTYERYKELLTFLLLHRN